jgi:hypothetical protein
VKLSNSSVVSVVYVRCAAKSSVILADLKMTYYGTVLLVFLPYFQYRTVQKVIGSSGHSLEIGVPVGDETTLKFQ